jgi:hypothetical protein
MNDICYILIICAPEGDGDLNLVMAMIMMGTIFIPVIRASFFRGSARPWVGISRTNSTISNSSSDLAEGKGKGKGCPIAMVSAENDQVYALDLGSSTSPPCR